MKKILIMLSVCALLPMTVMAKPKKPTNAVQRDGAESVGEMKQVGSSSATEEKAEAPVITEECLMNVSLFNESAKNKQYADAYEPWLTVLRECPNAHQAIYTRGSKILEWKYENATSEEEKQAIRELAMEMHNKRLKYLNDDPKYPMAYMLGQKGMDYCRFYENDELKLPAYPWLKAAAEGMMDKCQISVLMKFFEVSLGIYRSNPDQYGEQFINDYSTVATALQKMWDDPANKNASTAAQQKEYLDQVFASSGAASCEKLDAIYSTIVKNHSMYLEDMIRIMKMYKRIRCTESDVYFEAAMAAHKLQPTAESAAGCALMCMKKENWQEAINYYKQAISLITDDDDEEADVDRSEYLYNIAFIMYNGLHKYPEARNYALSSLESKPNQGRCYILIGLCYANSKPYSNSDMSPAKAAIMNKTAYWAAVDKFKKAKDVDSSCAELADNLIKTYSKYFPTNEEIFELANVFIGDTFIVGGWINEKTAKRSAR